MAGLAVFRAKRQRPLRSTAEVYKDVYNGWKWWHVYCYRCHGMNAVGGDLAPNLIDPNEKMPLPGFLTIVRNGSADRAMQAWDKLLDDKQSRSSIPTSGRGPKSAAARKAGRSRTEGRSLGPA